MTPDGFASDPRLETAVPTQKPGRITKIVFDGQGRMILALRGPIKNSFDFGHFTDADSGDVLRFAPAQPGTAPGALWTPSPQLCDRFLAGKPRGLRRGKPRTRLWSGRKYQPGLLQCHPVRERRCVTAGAAAADSISQGLQLNSADLVRPANEPPAQSAFVDFDGQPGDPAALGHVGDVAVFQRYAGEGAPLIAQGGPGVIGAPPVAEASCRQCKASRRCRLRLTWP